MPISNSLKSFADTPTSTERKDHKIRKSRLYYQQPHGSSNARQNSWASLLRHEEHLSTTFLEWTYQRPQHSKQPQCHPRGMPRRSFVIHAVPSNPRNVTWNQTKEHGMTTLLNKRNLRELRWYIYHLFEMTVLLCTQIGSSHCSTQVLTYVSKLLSCLDHKSVIMAYT